MHKLTGLILLLLAAMLTLLLLWLPVRYMVGYSISLESVSEIYLPCGSTIGILTGNPGPAVETPGERHQCVKEARGRIAYVVVFVGPLVVFGLYGVVRGRGRPEPLVRRS